MPVYVRLHRLRIDDVASFRKHGFAKIMYLYYARTLRTYEKCAHNGIRSALGLDLKRLTVNMQEDEAADWVEVRAVTVINCSSEAVFSFVCDPFNDVRWLTNVCRTEQLTAGTIRLGSRFRQAPVFLGVPVEVEWEVVDFVAKRRIRSRSVAGPLVFVRQYDCEPAGRGAQVTKFVRLNLAVVSPFVTRAAAAALLGNAADRALRRLKALLEGGSSPDHAS